MFIEAHFSDQFATLLESISSAFLYCTFDFPSGSRILTILSISIVLSLVAYKLYINIPQGSPVYSQLRRLSQIFIAEQGVPEGKEKVCIGYHYGNDYNDQRREPGVQADLVGWMVWYNREICARYLQVTPGEVSWAITTKEPLKGWHLSESSEPHVLKKLNDIYIHQFKTGDLDTDCLRPSKLEQPLGRDNS